MLNYLRENTGSIVVWLIVGMIAVVFALQFGPGSSGFQELGRSVTFAAKVYDRPITANEFASTLTRVRNYYESTYGVEVMKTLRIDEARIRKEALDQLIERELWAHAAEELGMTVGDEEMKYKILSDTSFYDDETGKFDEQRFTEYVNYYLKTSVKEYRARMRGQILAGRLQALVATSIKPTEEEVLTDWRVNNTSVNLEFVKLPDAAFKAAVALSKEDVDAALASREEEIKKKYEAVKATKYTEPKRVRARHILKKVPPDAPADVKESKRAEMTALLTRVRAGEDFGTIATAESDDESSALGGDLGWFDFKTMVPEFANVAFSLAPGEISDVVETQFGFHIIKVEEVKEEKVTSYDDVKRGLAEDILRDERGLVRAKDIAEKIHSELVAGAPDLAALVADAFPESAPASLPTTPDSLPADTPAPAAPLAIKADETGLVTPRSTYIRKIGDSTELFGEVFRLTPENPVVSKVYVLDNARFVIRLKERKSPDPAVWNKDKAKIMEEFARKRTESVVKAMTERLRTVAETDGAITIHPSTLAPPPEDGTAGTPAPIAPPPAPF